MFPIIIHVPLPKKKMICYLPFDLTLFGTYPPLKRNIKLNNDIGLNLTLNPMIPLEEFF
jgi:hypothetical protein